MNKKNLFLVAALIATITSCSGDGSYTNKSNVPAPVPGYSYVPSTPTPSVPVTPPTLPINPTNNPGLYKTLTNINDVPSSGIPYTRELPGSTEGGVNRKYKSSNDIQWNGDFEYDINNPENNHNTLYTGRGVKIGVPDTGFNDDPSPDSHHYWNELKDDLQSHIERIDNGVATNHNAWHGSMVAKIIASPDNGVAKNANLFVIDVSSGENDEHSSFRANDFQAIVDKNVDIISISQGTYNSKVTTAQNALGEDVYPILKNAVDKGMLVVFAAGNDEYNHSSPESSAPYYNPELEKGWLSAVGLYYKKGISREDTNDFKLSELQPSDNAGASANWTISALGERSEKFWGKDFKSAGSSFAAPYVAGVAALIKEKYPFMDGSLLRQTILSTATDIGDPGVDDVYGWGLLNVDKALNGPSQFVKRLALGDFVNITINDGKEYIFDNDITGDAGLNLQGNGTLVLNQNAEYTGGTIVGSGAYLKVRKDLASPMSIGAQGTVQLMNARTASIENNGTLINTGTSNIANLNSSANSTTVIDTTGRIHTLSANLNGNLVLTNNSEEYFTKNGKSIELITGNVKSNVNVVTPDLVNAKMTNGTADIARKDTVEYAKEAGADAQQLNTAQQVEASLQATDNDYESGTLTSKQAKSAASLQSLGLTSLDTLSGQIYASAQALTFEQSETINRVLSDRISSLDNALDSDSKYGFWMDGFYSKGQIEKDGYAKGKTKSNGGIAGFDTKLSDSTVIGASIDYSNAKVKFNRFNGESKSDLAGISAYARTNFGDSYAAGRVGYSDISSRVQREISTNINHWEMADIKHHDKMLSAYAELGHDFKKGNAKLTPYAGLSYDRLTRGSFEEDASYGLKADKKNYNMTSVTAGLKAKHTLRSKGDLKTTFSAYASYTKGLGNGKLDYEAKYNNSNGEFKVKGIDMSRDKVWAGVGVEKEVTKNFGVHANYDYKISTDHKKEHNNVISTGFRVQF